MRFEGVYTPIITSYNEDFSINRAGRTGVMMGETFLDRTRLW